jgi:hypothetical protein
MRGSEASDIKTFSLDDIERVGLDGRLEEGPIELIKDCLFEYPSLSRPSLTHLRIYKSRGRNIVIAGELGDNPGASLTNSMESLVESLRQAYFNKGQTFEVIEHYPSELPDREFGTFDKVIFSLDRLGKILGNIRWSSLDPALISEYIGMEVKVYPKSSYSSELFIVEKPLTSS